MKYFLIAASALSLVACDRIEHSKEVKDARVAAPVEKSNPEADQDLTRRVRALIIEDQNLSNDAKTIQIITANGIITLKGPVLNEAEKENIARKVRSIFGAQQIDNQLEPKQ